MMKFLQYYRLITEAEDFTVLSSKKFKGQNIIKMSLFRYKDGEKYRVVTTSLNDPSYSGFVEFDNKAKAIVAFNNVSTFDNLMHFMTNHKNDPEAFDFAIILAGEKEKGAAEPQANPFDVVPMSEPEMGGGSSASPFAAPSGAPPTGATPPTPETNIAAPLPGAPGAPPPGVTPTETPLAPPLGPTMVGGAPETAPTGI